MHTENLMLLFQRGRRVSVSWRKEEPCMQQRLPEQSYGSEHKERAQAAAQRGRDLLRTPGEQVTEKALELKTVLLAW